MPAEISPALNDLCQSFDDMLRLMFPGGTYIRPNEAPKRWQWPRLFAVGNHAIHASLPAQRKGDTSQIDVAWYTNVLGGDKVDLASVPLDDFSIRDTTDCLGWLASTRDEIIDLSLAPLAKWFHPTDLFPGGLTFITRSPNALGVIQTLIGTGLSRAETIKRLLPRIQPGIIWETSDSENWMRAMFKVNAVGEGVMVGKAGRHGTVRLKFNYFENVSIDLTQNIILPTPANAVRGNLPDFQTLMVSLYLAKILEVFLKHIDLRRLDSTANIGVSSWT